MAGELRGGAGWSFPNQTIFGKKSGRDEHPLPRSHPTDFWIPRRYETHPHRHAARFTRWLRERLSDYVGAQSGIGVGGDAQTNRGHPWQP